MTLEEQIKEISIQAIKNYIPALNGFGQTRDFNWFCELIGAGKKKARLVLNLNRNELEGFVQYPDEGGNWAMHEYQMREWVAKNFKKIANTKVVE